MYKEQCIQCKFFDKKAPQWWCSNLDVGPINRDNKYIKALGVLNLNPHNNCKYFEAQRVPKEKKNPWWKFWKRS